MKMEAILILIASSLVAGEWKWCRLKNTTFHSDTRALRNVSASDRRRCESLCEAEIKDCLSFSYRLHNFRVLCQLHSSSPTIENQDLRLFCGETDVQFVYQCNDTFKLEDKCRSLIQSNMKTSRPIQSHVKTSPDKSSAGLSSAVPFAINIALCMLILCSVFICVWWYYNKCKSNPSQNQGNGDPVGPSNISNGSGVSYSVATENVNVDCGDSERSNGSNLANDAQRRAEEDHLLGGNNGDQESNGASGTNQPTEQKEISYSLDNTQTVNASSVGSTDDCVSVYSAGKHQRGKLGE